MKRFVFIAIVMLSLPALADYTYIVTDGMDISDLGTSVLTDHQSLLMTGGGGYNLNLHDYSTAVIQGTAPYNQEIYPAGGIERLSAGDYAHLVFSSGEVYEIGIGYYATAILNGGIISRLKTTQSAWQWQYYPEPQPPVLIWTPHVEMIVKDWDYNTVTKTLSGIWGNDSTFNIQLVDVAGYSPTIEDIKFTIIPEPATLLLISLGGLFLRYRRN